MSEEGWYLDPFELHEHRWISLGKPTKLVRDKGVESYDEPPSAEIAVELIPADDPEPTDGEDLIRADEQPRSANYNRAVLDVFDQTSHTW